jgi:tetratricopeptide (TPR) repeat protein
MVSVALSMTGFAAALLVAQSSLLVAQTSLFDPHSAPKTSVSSPAQQQTKLSPENRGDILMARKMYREAVDVFREGPDNSAVLHNKTGIAFHQMLNLPSAKKEYELALKLDPQYAEAVNNLGAVYYGQKSYRRAIRSYKKALQLSPKGASIYSNLGTAYFARKNYKEAAAAYQTALLLDPEVFEHRNSYGSLLQERSVNERAKFHYYLAKTYAKAGMNDRALQYIRKALEEGFTERKKFLEEAEFTGLRTMPEFQQLMVLEPKVL